MDDKKVDVFDVKAVLNEMVESFNDRNDKPHQRFNREITTDIHKDLLHNTVADSGIGINGYYYIYHHTGPWLANAIKESKDRSLRKNWPYLSPHFGDNFHMGALAKSINIPELFMDFDNISGRSKSLVSASKESYNGDFTIDFVENNHFDIIAYHDLWYKYIKYVKNGEIKRPDTHTLKYHYEVDYHNSVFVIFFDPAMHVRIISKIMGVQPVSIPLKEYVGNREKPDIVKPTINYKSTNMMYEVFHDYNGLSSSGIWNEFAKVFKGGNGD